MSNPYFSIGEEATIVSKRFPENNGDTTILEMIPPRTEINPRSGMRFKHHDCEEIRYWTDTSKVTAACNGWVLESSLRKKHKPSDESFSEIMANYKTPADAKD